MNPYVTERVDERKQTEHHPWMTGQIGARHHERTGKAGPDSISWDRRAETGQRAAGGRGYAIRVTGVLDRRWWAWFAGHTITTEPSNETVLWGENPDQRSLIGALVTLHELGYPLVSVTRRLWNKSGQAPGQ